MSTTTTCLQLSTFADPVSFHTLLNHSPGVREFSLHLDHLGIVIVIWGSTIASTYVGFYCGARTRNTYFVLATTLGATAAYATFTPFLKTAAGRNLRCLAYALLGLTAFASASHGVMVNGWEEQNHRQSLTYFIGLAMLNGLGTLVYAARVPERWFPRTFDLLGSSHQILHVLVILGAYSHSVGLHKALQYWQANSELLESCS